MQLEVRGRDVEFADAMRNHVRRRLRFALGRFDDRIRHVTVRISDLNGPRGGVDKLCRINIVLSRCGTLVLEETSGDLVTAIDRAADRAGHAVSRKVQHGR
jgi:putative sigma-54 modulation protein